MGDGEVDAAGVSHHVRFRVVERSAGAEAGDFEYWFDDKPARGGNAPRRHRFDAQRVSSVTFTDDPAIQPGSSAGRTVDTVAFTGTGRWDGAGGYTFEVRAVDAGEPGPGRDEVSVTIRNSRGVIVESFSGRLMGGNIQSSRLDGDDPRGRDQR